jgi:hypothetical protein
MNISNLSRLSAAGLLIAVLLTSTAVAGPGPYYRARMDKHRKSASYPSAWRTQADDDTKAQAAAGCTDCQGCAKKS